MTPLNLLAVQNGPLLAAIERAERDKVSSISGLAEVIQRDPSNVSKSIKALQADGLVEADWLKNGLTADGCDQLAAIRRAEGTGAGEEGSEPHEPGSSPGSSLSPASPDHLHLFHAQILPDAANARRDWASDEAKDELDALRQDILQNGLLQNLVVRPAGADDLQGVAIEVHDPVADQRTRLPLYRLVGGERRWRAIEAAIRDGDWSPDRQIPCRVLDTDDLGHRLAALAENIQRRNLNPLEKAQAFEGLAEAGLTNQQIADRISATPEHVQQHRRFLQLDDADQQRMTLPRDDPRRLSVRDARQKLARKDEDQPPELSPESILLAAELGHLARATGGRWAAWTRVGSAFHADPLLEQLRGVVHADTTPNGWGDDCGYFQAYLPSSGARAVVGAHLPWLDDDDAAVRDAALKALQADNGVAPEAGAAYVSPALNGPFQITPEGQAVLDERVAAAARHAQVETARLADIAARDIRWKQARERHALIFAVAQERPVADRPEDAREIAQEIDRPLPWTVNDKGEVLDAKVAKVTSFGFWNGCSDQGLVTAQLVVAAVNAAGGLITPAAGAAEPDEPEQDIDGNDPDADDAADDGADD